MKKTDFDKEIKIITLADGKLLGFMTVKEAALKYNVGTETINAWIRLGKLKYIMLNSTVYILDDLKTGDETK